MKNVCIVFLLLFVTVCSAARFPFQARVDSHCADCSGLFKDCFCADLDDCARFGCSDVGECSRATCRSKRKREPNDCPDCAGFPAGCPCDAYDICKSEGCFTGDCTGSNCEKKRSLDELFLKRTSNDCPDCAGFGPGCGCENYKLCKSEGCHDTGECTASNCGNGKRTFADLLTSLDEGCADCPGFGPGCPCADALYCMDKCKTAGDCKFDNCAR